MTSVFLNFSVYGLSEYLRTSRLQIYPPQQVVEAGVVVAGVQKLDWLELIPVISELS